MGKDKANTPSFSSTYSGLVREGISALALISLRSVRQRLKQGVVLGLLAVTLSACGFVDEGVNKSEPPIVGDDVYPVDEAGTLDEDASTGVLANDSDAGGAALTAKLVSGPAHTTNFNLNSDGSFVYEHDGSEPHLYATPGIDTFVYVANDGVKDSEAKTVVIEVAPVNDPPVIVGLQTDPNPFASLEDATVSMGTALSVQDPDNNFPNDFTFDIAAGANYTISGGNIVPAQDYNGTLNVSSVTVNDGTETSNSFAFSVTVLPVNDAPVISGQNATATPEDMQRTIARGDLIFDDVDNPNNTLTLTVLPPAGGANYSVTGNIIQPAADYNGSLSVPVTLSDGEADSTPFNLAVTVTPVNDVPVIVTQNAVATPEDTTRAVALTDLTVTDVDNPAADFQLILLPPGGGANYTIAGTNIIPAANYSGALAVPLAVSDGIGSSATFNLAVTVMPVNDPPVISGQNPVTTAEDTPREIVAGDLMINDIDSPGPFQVVVLPPGGGANYTVAGTTITPVADFNGTLTVPVQVNDGVDNSAPFNLAVSVAAANDPPVVVNQQVAATVEDTPLTITVADHLTVTDVDNAQNELSVVLEPAGANYSVAGNNDQVVPDPDFNGTLTVPLRVSDGVNLSAIFNLSVTVAAVNDPPTVNQNVVTTMQDTPRTITFADLIVTDPDTPAAQWVLALDQVNGLNHTVSGNTITPNAGYVGNLTVPLTVSDGIDATPFNLQVSVTAIVSQANGGIANRTSADLAASDTPAGATCFTTPQEQTLGAALPGEPSLSSPLTYSLVNGALNGDVSVDATGQFTYAPNLGSPRGRDSFDYQVSDANGDIRTRTANVITDYKIMPLGDSVTTGVTDASDTQNQLPVVALREGYRRPLLAALRSAGYGIDFVGGQSHGNGVTSGFDSDNEGHDGWSAIELALGSAAQDPVYPDSGIYYWLTQTPTDVVLLHTGTDVRAVTVDGVAAILDAIDRWENDTGNAVTVLLARIIDRNPSSGEVAAFNSSLQSLAETRVASGDNIVVVDQQRALQDANGLPDPTLYGDAIHPNASGYGKMAETWLKPLTDVLEQCP